MYITESFLNCVHLYCVQFCRHFESTKSPKQTFWCNSACPGMCAGTSGCGTLGKAAKQWLCLCAKCTGNKIITEKWEAYWNVCILYLKDCSSLDPERIANLYSCQLVSFSWPVTILFSMGNAERALLFRRQDRGLI